MREMVSKIFGSSKEILPKEDTTYTYNKKGSSYDGTTGVVSHHNCGTRFMIFTGDSWLCNIKP